MTFVELSNLPLLAEARVAQRCSLCNYPDQAAVRLAFTEGLSDRAIGRRFGMSHVAVGNHRKEHLLRRLVAAEDREAKLAAIGKPAVVVRARITYDGQAEKIETQYERYERANARAEAEGNIAALVSLAGPTLKSIEAGCKLAQTGGYAHGLPVIFSWAERDADSSEVGARRYSRDLQRVG